MKRVLTAAVALPLVVGLLFWAPARSVRLAFAFAALLCLSEFLKIAAAYGAEPMRLAAYLAGAWIVAAESGVGLPLLLGVTMLLLTLAMRGDRDLKASMPSVAYTLLGVVYTAIPFRLAADLHAHPGGPHWLVFVLLAAWLGDSAAYYVGRSLGRHALAPTISPKKTWEGAAASVAAAAVAGPLYLRHFLAAPPAWAVAIGLAIVVNMAAQVGDLAESALKRGVGMKDSGAILPGHGGMLDRLDGVLFAVPVVYWVVVR